MLRMFSGERSEHPLADLKEVRQIVAALSGSDVFTSLEEINHWLESARTEPSFKPEHRAQLVQVLDEAGQAPVRKLGREYLSVSRLGKQQETRTWNAIHEFWKKVALGYVTCLDSFATNAKGADALKSSLPLLGARAIRALATELKWLHVRYGPLEQNLWTTISRVYTLLESKKAAQASVNVYPGNPVASTAAQEFLRAAMFGACSPDSLLPLEMEIAERIIAHCAGHFLFGPQPQPSTLYWIDIAQGEAPVRLARPPQPSPGVRFFGAGAAVEEIVKFAEQIRAWHELPSALGFGDAYSPEMVLEILEHLEHCWSTKPAVRRHPRHRVKSRLTIAWGFDGMLEVLQPKASLDFADSRYESWIVENVSVGGFGALVPQVRGDWLRIGCLIAMQPEGGKNWLVGVVRRLSRPTLEQAAVGIQTLARTASAVELRIQTGNLTSLDTEQGILLDPTPAGGEVQLLVRQGVNAPGQTFVLEGSGRRTILLPAGVAERGQDYELIRCRPFVQDAS